MLILLEFILKTREIYFHKKKIHFLDFIAKENKIYIYPDMIQDIKKYKTITNTNEP